MVAVSPAPSPPPPPVTPVSPRLQMMNDDASDADSTRPPTFREALENSMVRQRIIEYLGGSRLEDATCLFLGHIDPLNPSRIQRLPSAKLHALLDEGCELARSLADRSSMLIHLDIEYVNFDDPSVALLNPQRVFLLQQPLVKVIESRLLALGIHPLHLVTGQGHHFVWKIRKSSAVAKDLAGLGICSSPGQKVGAEPLFSHVALLMEYLAHLLKPESAAHCEVPVEITAQHVGSGRSGAREMLSIDISEYGDPLHSRMIRIPYTAYRKPWLSGLIDRLGIGHQVPEFFTLPLFEMDILHLINHRHHPGTVIDLAHRGGVEIPLEEMGTRHLLEAYLASNLAAFHRKFYATNRRQFTGRHAAAELSTAFHQLPPCAKHVMTFPNDLLLKPSGMQLITRCLLAQDWHPRHIAGLMATIFRDPIHQWGCQWDDYDPGLRAEFYVRLFAGAIDQGLEKGIDFNCRSQQEKQFCWNPDHCSLDPIMARIYPVYKPQPLSP